MTLTASTVDHIAQRKQVRAAWDKCHFWVVFLKVLAWLQNLISDQPNPNNIDLIEWKLHVILYIDTLNRTHWNPKLA